MGSTNVERRAGVGENAGFVCSIAHQRKVLQMQRVKKTFRLCTWGSIGALGLFSLAYAAYWIPPEFGWWLQLLAVGLPVVIALLIAWAVVLIGCRAWGWLIAIGTVIGLYLVRHEALGIRRPAAAGSDTLVVMTYNIPDSRRPVLADSLAKLVARYRPQLIGFQEVGIWWYVRPRQRTTLRLVTHLKPLVEQQGYLPSKPDVEVGPLFAEVVTLTQLPVLAQHIRSLAEGTDALVYQAVRSELCWEGRRFVHYNVRLQSYGPLKPWEVLRDGGWKHPANWRRWLTAYRKAMLERAKQVRQLRVWIDQEHLPIILSGDLNSTPDQWFYGQLAQGLQAAGRLGGIAAPSWPATRPLVRIDHVLVSPEWEVLEGAVPPIGLSDHRPVIARLRWRQSSEYAETCVGDAPSAHF